MNPDGGNLPVYLQSAQVPAFSNAECQALYSGFDVPHNFEHYVCAGGSGQNFCAGVRLINFSIIYFSIFYHSSGRPGEVGKM